MIKLCVLPRAHGWISIKYIHHNIYIDISTSTIRINVKASDGHLIPRATVDFRYTTPSWTLDASCQWAIYPIAFMNLFTWIIFTDCLQFNKKHIYILATMAYYFIRTYGILLLRPLLNGHSVYWHAVLGRLLFMTSVIYTSDILYILLQLICNFTSLYFLLITTLSTICVLITFLTVSCY